MTDDLYDRVVGRTLRELLAEHPVAADFFVNYNLQNLRGDLPLAEALDYADENTLIDFGLDKTTVLDQLVLFLRTVVEEKQTAAVQDITILGGRTKSGEAEEFTLIIQPARL